MRSYYRLHGVSAADLAAALWHKSSFSAASGSSAHLARPRARRKGVSDPRDDEQGSIPFFTRAEWEAFMSGAERSECDSI
jgi:Domain of unknown function (DUF397)